MLDDDLARVRRWAVSDALGEEVDCRLGDLAAAGIDPVLPVSVFVVPRSSMHPVQREYFATAVRGVSPDVSPVPIKDEISTALLGSLREAT